MDVPETDAVTNRACSASEVSIDHCSRACVYKHAVMHRLTIESTISFIDIESRIERGSRPVFFFLSSLSLLMKHHSLGIVRLMIEIKG